MPLVYKHLKSPVGNLKLIADGRSLVAVLWENDRPGRVRLGVMVRDDEHPILVRASRQLAEYFAGERTAFDLPLEPAGTVFQKKVWQALTRIPFAKTASYRELAGAIGSPKACRAVGAANGRNPLSIVVPCHRVIGSRGKLTGFAGGLETKAKLLAHEAKFMACH